MLQRLRKVVFGLYEQAPLRNWFYTLAFAIVVPTGCRFAIVAWEYGSWFDKPLTIVAGTVIGVTAIVTLLRVWEVPPIVTVSHADEKPRELPAQFPPSEMLSMSRHQAAMNREFARDARSLGSTRT